MSSSLPEGWRPIRPDEAASVAALIDADDVAVGFRSRLGEQEIVDMWAHTDLEHDSWLHEDGGRVLRLYESAGMHVEAEHATFRKDLV